MKKQHDAVIFLLAPINHFIKQFQQTSIQITTCYNCMQKTAYLLIDAYSGT